MSFQTKFRMFCIKLWNAQLEGRRRYMQRPSGRKNANPKGIGSPPSVANRALIPPNPPLCQRFPHKCGLGHGLSMTLDLYSSSMSWRSLIGKSLHKAILLALFPLIPAGPSFASDPVYSFTNAAATGNTGPTQAQITTAYSGTSLAGAVTINTQGIQEWVVPTTGYYGFEVAGGHGAASTGATNTRGGRSALITAKKTLSAGTRIYIVVGQAGTANSSHGGGGGASFVRIGLGSDTSTLIVAGGGGGTRAASSANGGDASTTTSGTSTGALYNVGTTTTFYPNTSANSYPVTSTPPLGTTSNAYTIVGFGGLASISNFGDGGAGWLGNGYDDGAGATTAAVKLSDTAIGGGGAVGALGGFGGGGNGTGGMGGGGGGGYTGGNSGHIAGGGGSFVNGFDTQTITIDTARSFLRGGTAVHGYVTISLLTPPGPTTVNLSIAGGVSTVNKGTPITLTAAVGSPGRITFYANNKKIPGCINRLVSTSVNCNWKPPTQGNVVITAILLPTDSAFTRSPSSDFALLVSRRSGLR